MVGGGGQGRGGLRGSSGPGTLPSLFSTMTVWHSESSLKNSETSLSLRERTQATREWSRNWNFLSASLFQPQSTGWDQRGDGRHPLFYRCVWTNKSGQNRSRVLTRPRSSVTPSAVVGSPVDRTVRRPSQRQTPELTSQRRLTRFNLNASVQRSRRTWRQTCCPHGCHGSNEAAGGALGGSLCFLPHSGQRDREQR